MTSGAHPPEPSNRPILVTGGTGTLGRPILVTGGTGTLGRHVVSRLRAEGRVVRILGRGDHPVVHGMPGVQFVTADLSSPAPLDGALDGVEIVVHLAGSAKGDEGKAQHLVDAAVGSEVRHIVYISVVGADRIPIESGLDRTMFGYFAAKLEAERIIADSGVPWSTLRATQFHDAAFATVQVMARLPVIPVPAGFSFQPIDPAEVADRLVELALGSPSGLVPEMGGPRVYAMADLVRSYLRAAGKHRLIVPMPLPGHAAAAFRHGANLTPERRVGRRTWEDFLRVRMPPRGDSISAPT
jgi:uncharacterized protein YbjT (DUF2867 family)